MKKEYAHFKKYDTRLGIYVDFNMPKSGKINMSLYLADIACRCQGGAK